MVESLDHKLYNRADLSEIKVALHLPYSNDSKDFERYDGSIVLNGTTYNYVERMIKNDTLILHCIPNNNADKVKLALNEYNKCANDIQSPKKSQKSDNASLLLKSLECAAYKHSYNFACYSSSFITIKNAYRNISDKLVSDKFNQSPEQPPDAAI